MAFFSVLSLGWPKQAAAFTLPQKISVTAGDTVRIIEPQQFTHWFTLGQKTVFTPDSEPEIELVKSGCQSYLFFCAFFVPRLTLSHFTTEETFALNENQAVHFLQSIMEDLERDPVNAKLSLDAQGNLSIASAAVPGLRIDQNASLTSALQTLKQARTDEIELAFVTELLPAKISQATIHELGLHDKLSEGKTNFRGSPKNRIFNIHRALEQFDGIVIAPGEEFSFVDHLGEVDGEHGYLPELVIKNNKTEPEFGGGICQVSTTVFRAALLAGLEITERRNHAYPVQYYKPYGLDATIYIPRPDLKFKNNTPSPILMLPKIDGTELSFIFYGTSDGRTTTIDGPHILESNPDGSMRTIFTQTVTAKDGETMVNVTFPSNYKSPSLFPHPGEETLTEKPKNWSNRQWKEYRAIHP